MWPSALPPLPKKEGVSRHRQNGSGVGRKRGKVLWWPEDDLVHTLLITVPQVLGEYIALTALVKYLMCLTHTCSPHCYWTGCYAWMPISFSWPVLRWEGCRPTSGSWGRAWVSWGELYYVLKWDLVRRERRYFSSEYNVAFAEVLTSFYPSPSPPNQPLTHYLDWVSTQHLPPTP